MTKKINMKWKDKIIELNLSDDAAGICIAITQLKEEIRKMRERWQPHSV